MKELFNFLAENWLVFSPLVLTITLRIWPTEKDWDIVKPIFKFLDTIIPNLKKGGGKFTLVVLMTIMCQVGYSQIYQAYRGIIYTGEADSTIFPTVDGMITYNRQTGKLQGREGGVYQNLISSGGGGTVTGATNGTQLIGTQVGLGTSLTQNTLISGANANNLTFSTIPSFILTTSIGGTMFIGSQGGTIGIGGGSPNEIDIHGNHTIFESVADADVIAGDELNLSAVNNIVATSSSGFVSLNSGTAALFVTNAGASYQLSAAVGLQQNFRIQNTGYSSDYRVLSDATTDYLYTAGSGRTSIIAPNESGGADLEVYSASDGTQKGNVLISSNPSGAGAAGNLTLQVNGGELFIEVNRTSCAGAPSGAVANISGVLTICP